MKQAGSGQAGGGQHRIFGPVRRPLLAARFADTMRRE
jgi:hypothetical protein